jgi:hypothetical protein
MGVFGTVEWDGGAVGRQMAVKTPQGPPSQPHSIPASKRVAFCPTAVSRPHSRHCCVQPELWRLTEPSEDAAGAVRYRASAHSPGDPAWYDCGCHDAVYCLEGTQHGCARLWTDVRTGVRASAWTSLVILDDRRRTFENAATIGRAASQGPVFGRAGSQRRGRGDRGRSRGTRSIRF